MAKIEINKECMVSEFPSGAAEMNYKSSYQSYATRMFIFSKSEASLDQEFGAVARAHQRQGDDMVWSHRGMWDGINSALPVEKRRKREF